MATASINDTCRLIYIGIVVVVHHVTPMMQSYYSIDLLEEVCTLCQQCSQLPNHTNVGCPSRSYDLIYDIAWVWPNSSQERNALIPHLHEHDNLGEFMAISTMRMRYDLP
jgi:hypothetical protein